jgi:transcriptional regulator with GAF, ATPase, and Fis domain
MREGPTLKKAHHQKKRIPMNTEYHEAQVDPIGLFIEYICQQRKISLKDFLTRVELNLIILSLNETNGNQRKAAKILGLKPTTLNEKLRRYKIGFRKTAVDRKIKS